MVPAQGHAVLRLSAMVTDPSLSRAQPTTYCLPQCSSFIFILTFPFFPSSFFRITGAAGHFGVSVSGTIKSRMMAIRLTYLSDLPDAHYFIMGLLISLVE